MESPIGESGGSSNQGVDGLLGEQDPVTGGRGYAQWPTNPGFRAMDGAGIERTVADITENPLSNETYQFWRTP